MMGNEASLRHVGRVWLFGDGVNTDELYPGFAMKLPIAEAARHMFHATRPGWTSEVQPGDIVVGGRGFGMGSSRPVPVLFKQLGIGCVLAEQFNSLFFRNCINYGLGALNVPGVASLLREGDTAEVDIATAVVRNVTTGMSTSTQRLPEFVLDILRAGGLQPMLRARGLVLDEDNTRT